MAIKGTMLRIYTIYTGLAFLFYYFYQAIIMSFLPGSTIMPFAWICLIFTWPIIFLKCLIAAIRNRQWRRSIKIICLPTVAALLFLMLQQLGITAERLRLEYNLNTYMQEIAELQTNGNPPYLKTWFWGEYPLFLGPNVQYVLLYDDSDQIASPPQARTATWKQRFVSADYNDLFSEDAEYWQRPFTIQPLGKHFYLLIASW